MVSDTFTQENDHACGQISRGERPVGKDRSRCRQCFFDKGLCLRVNGRIATSLSCSLTRPRSLPLEVWLLGPYFCLTLRVFLSPFFGSDMRFRRFLPHGLVAGTRPARARLSVPLTLKPIRLLRADCRISRSLNYRSPLLPKAGINTNYGSLHVGWEHRCTSGRQIFLPTASGLHALRQRSGEQTW